jgi:hypothetical protein
VCVCVCGNVIGEMQSRNAVGEEVRHNAMWIHGGARKHYKIITRADSKLHHGDVARASGAASLTSAGDEAKFGRHTLPSPQFSYA